MSKRRLKKPELRADYIWCNVNQILLMLSSPWSVVSRKKYGFEQFFKLPVLDIWLKKDRDLLISKLEEYPGKHYPESGQKLKKLFENFEKDVLERLSPIISLPRDEDLINEVLTKENFTYINLSKNALEVLTENIDGYNPICVAKERFEVEIFIYKNRLIIEGEKSSDAINWMMRMFEHMPFCGMQFEGEVRTVKDFGAFVDFGPNREGLAHVSNISGYKHGRLDAYLAVGDQVIATLLSQDNRGRIRLSIDEIIRPKGENK